MYKHLCMFALLVLTLSGCGSGGSGGVVAGTDPGTPSDQPNTPAEPATISFSLPAGKTAFFNPGKDITPFIVATASNNQLQSIVRPKGWDSSNPLNYAFRTLRQYNNDTDNGVLGMSNMYKLLYEAGGIYETIAINIELDPEGTSLGPDGKVVLSPFDFGTTPRVYTHAFTEIEENGSAKSGALAKNGDTYTALLTFIWDESNDPTYPGKKSYGVIEGSFGDLETGDLEIDLAYMVDYNNGTAYCIRTHVSGNAGAHNFNLVTAVGNKNPDIVYGLASAGISYSEIDGNDDYFLIKFDGKGVDNKFFRVSALSPDETDLMSYLETGYSIDEISDPANYAAEMNALEFFTISDIPMQLSEFTNSSVMLDY